MQPPPPPAVDGQVVIRPADEGDDAFLHQLATALAVDVLGPAGLPPAQLDLLVRTQATARAQGYAASFPHATSWIAEVGSEPVGRALVDELPQLHRLVDLAVEAGSRTRGIGGALVHFVQDRAAAAGAGLVLRADPADTVLLAWYERSGFHATGRDDTAVHFRWDP